jgi:hypothetical protein
MSRKIKPPKYRRMMIYKQIKVDIGVAGHAKCKKLTRKIQKNLHHVIKKPLESFLSRGFKRYLKSNKIVIKADR